MDANRTIVIIGAGPVGLAAAAHAVRRGLTPLVLEQGATVGAAIRDWGHVRLFSPWSFNIDDAARALLQETDWQPPDPAALPTGAEIVRDYLEPLASHPRLAPHIVTGATVMGVSRQHRDKVVSIQRETIPFIVRWRTADGDVRETLAGAIIDASGTWRTPNPMGTDGLSVAGEAEAAQRIAYGIPDVVTGSRHDYANQRVLVIGGGHSAVNAVLDLIRLRRTAPATHVLWAMRGNRLDRLVGGGSDDALPARGHLGLAAQQAVERQEVEILAPFSARRIENTGDSLRVHGVIGQQTVTLNVDRIVVATGFRPDPALLRELRITLDSALEAPPALAPLIDPNIHSCGTVPPHGVVELTHPEPGVYIVGAKSYGRAPTFLMRTGYEQVRSVVAEIAGDHEAARRVELELPETGVCSTDSEPQAAAEGCCGGPAPDNADACCVRDAQAKAAGQSGCGCGTSAPEAPPRKTACCGG
ncbi:MAG: NAD(P)-binding domain-containing protein [Aquisalimonadaceae bacterium]